MRPMKVSFDVEQAGCQSCAARVRAALTSLGVVEAVEIDESADMASVVLVTQSGEADQVVVDGALAEASGAGHLYRVRPGSWRENANGTTVTL